MTLGGLQFDSGMLDTLGSSMNQIRSVLDGAGGMANNDAKAAGDDALSEVIHEFANDWRKTRNKMLKDIDSFASMVSGVMDSFTKLDNDLTSAITVPSTPSVPDVLNG